MTSTHEHFGTGAGQMALPLDTPDTKGNFRTCIGVVDLQVGACACVCVELRPDLRQP